MTTLNELEALAKAATPGPWETNKADIISNVIEVIANNGYVSVCDADPYDALFIAHANPQTILQMIALIRQMEDALKEAETAMVDHGTSYLNHEDEYATGVGFAHVALEKLRMFEHAN